MVTLHTARHCTTVAAPACCIVSLLPSPLNHTSLSLSPLLYSHPSLALTLPHSSPLNLILQHSFLPILCKNPFIFQLVSSRSQQCRRRAYRPRTPCPRALPIAAIRLASLQSVATTGGVHHPPAPFSSPPPPLSLSHDSPRPCFSSILVLSSSILLFTCSHHDCVLSHVSPPSSASPIPLRPPSPRRPLLPSSLSASLEVLTAGFWPAVRRGSNAHIRATYLSRGKRLLIHIHAAARRPDAACAAG